MLARTLIPLAIALALPALAPAAVSTGHSGWEWGNPTPQGNNLGAVEFVGETGYAAGDFGTLLRSVDGGASWSAVRTGLSFNFNKIDVIDEDSVVVGNECALRRTDDAGATFTRLPYTASEGTCARRLLTLSFPTPETGFLLLEDGSLLQTADGGESFSTRTDVPSAAGGAPRSMIFTTPTNGLATTSAGEIVRTVDGGVTWTPEFDHQNGLNALFVAGQTAVAVGDQNAFVASSDGGDNWTEPSRPIADEPVGTPPPPSYSFTGIGCLASACLMTSQGGTVVRTTDGGATFKATTATGIALDLVSATRAVSVGGAGATFATDDSGATWTRVGGALPIEFFIRVRATSASVAHAAGRRGGLARTTDGGETWTDISAATAEDVIDVSFPTADLGFALDGNGGLSRTKNGGKTWGVLETGTTDRPNALLAPDTDTVMLIGPRGIRWSTDGGETFARHRHKDVRIRTLTDVDKAGSAIVVFGPRVLAMSKNGGKTWRRVIRPTQKAELLSVDFVSAKRGFIVMDNSRVYTTGDGGKTWSELPAVGTSLVGLLAFADGRNGWMSAGGGSVGPRILRTENGGKSWRPQIVGQGFVGSLAAGGPKSAFAHVSGTASLVHTSNGGDAGAPSSLTISTKTPVIRKTTSVRIKGKLAPAEGGERVVVSMRQSGSSRWATFYPAVSGDGSFSFKRRIGRTSVFVAQWDGDADSAGAGSKALTVTRKP